MISFQSKDSMDLKHSLDLLHEQTGLNCCRLSKETYGYVCFVTSQKRPLFCADGSANVYVL